MTLSIQRLIFSAAACALAAAAVRAAVPAPDPDDGAIELPAGFRAVVVADNLGSLRFMAATPSGDLYIKTDKEGIVALRDTNGDGRADVRETFGSGGGTGIAVRDGWLYHSTNQAVYRYRLTPGQLVPKGEQETIVSGLPEGPEHWAKSFGFDEAGRLFVEVGSPSNSFGEPDRAPGSKGKDATEFLKTHGGFWRFDPDKPNQTQADGHHFSTGHRHVLALAWNAVSKAFFFVMMGRDQLSTVAPQFYSDDDNAEQPSEVMHVLREGANFGWPYTYYDPLKKARMVAPEYGGDNQKRAEPGLYPEPLIAFPAHWAPMQMAFYKGEQFPAKYRNGAFIAFHGSWNRAPRPQKGYNVVYIPFDPKGMPRGDYEVFASGFPGVAEFTSPEAARFRPIGLCVGPEGSLYVADSEKGRVWRIVYTGETRAAAKTPATSGAGTTAMAARGGDEGAVVYQKACATCHMANGSGVSGLQPALVGSTVVTGDPGTLIRVVLRGPAVVLPRSKTSANQMPPFGYLSDQEVAAALSYVRQEFGKGAGLITPTQVAGERARP